MLIKTKPGAGYGKCSSCDEEIEFPVNIIVELTEQGVRAKVDNINLQPMYDHQFEEHFGVIE